MILVAEFHCEWIMTRVNAYKNMIYILEFLKVKFSNLNFKDVLIPFKPSVPYMGHSQKGQTQMRRHVMWRLIRVFTVCLKENNFMLC